MPERLAEQTTLKQQVQEALATVTAEDGPTRINLTDQDAVLVRTRQGHQAGYNGQAQVAGLAPTVAGQPGLLITAAELVATASDHGRTLEVGPDDAALRRHRAWMATPDARTAYRRRKTLPEPVLGILKEQQAARRLLLRGLAHVRAEWSLLATAFNLRTLARCWQAGTLATHHLTQAGLG